MKMGYDRIKPKIRVCKVCNNKFSSPYPSHKYCSKECKRESVNKIARDKRFTEQYRSSNCPICHNQFFTIRSFKTYCSRKCSKRASYEQLREEQLEIARLRYKNEPEFRLRIKMRGMNPEVRIKSNAQQRNYRKEHHDEMLAEEKEYRKKYKDRIKMTNKKYELTHKDKIRKYHQQYKQRNLIEFNKRAARNKRKHWLKERKLRNELRRKEGLPLIGEGNYHESKLKKLLDKLFIGIIPYDNRYWGCNQSKLVNHCSQRYGLQLDRYYLQIKLAFEYDGRQHIHYIPKFHKSLKEFIALQERDKRKNEMCKQAGVLLIRLSHKDHIDTETVVDKILNTSL